jgi:valyl-tRNA synthetase
MLSTQWFVRMKPLAGPALAAVRYGRTRFVPKQWENTYFSWLDDIQDWCVSRQLWWGHRIPAWTCDACGHLHVARSAPEACVACGTTALTQDPDVLDTWFSSALWPFSVFGWPENTADLQRYYPTSVLVTGFDIIFFWVARMMFAGLHFVGEVPFRDVYIHALVRDENRQKMSKTKGNVVDPLEVVETAGADAFRFTLMSLAAQGRDVVWNPARVEDSQRFVTKIWQALRYAFLHREGYDPAAPRTPGPYEAWIAARSAEAVTRVREALDGYRFNEAAHEIHAFVWGELCDWYLELSKTTLYDEAADPARKNAAKHALFTAFDLVARLVHPFMPFLSEEIWSRLPGHEDGAAGFVATAPYPRADELAGDAGLLAEVALLQEAIGAVRNLRGEMEISPRVPMRLVVADPKLRATLTRHARALHAMAGVEVVEGHGGGAASAVVIGRAECLVPLEGVVDVAAELDRLVKAIGTASKDVETLSAKVEQLVAGGKAPAHVVEEFTGKLDAARERLGVLTRNRARLGGG